MVLVPVGVEALPSALMLLPPALVSVSRAVGFAVETVIVFEVDPMRPALSVTTRFTVYCCAVGNVCEIVRFEAPHRASPGHVMSGVPSPKFHSYFVMVWPCPVVDVAASNVTV